MSASVCLKVFSRIYKSEVRGGQLGWLPCQEGCDPAVQSPPQDQQLKCSLMKNKPAFHHPSFSFPSFPLPSPHLLPRTSGRCLAGEGSGTEGGPAPLGQLGSPRVSLGLSPAQGHALQQRAQELRWGTCLQQAWWDYCWLAVCHIQPVLRVTAPFLTSEELQGQFRGSSASGDRPRVCCPESSASAVKRSLQYPEMQDRYQDSFSSSSLPMWRSWQHQEDAGRLFDMGVPWSEHSAQGEGQQ